MRWLTASVAAALATMVGVQAQAEPLSTSPDWTVTIGVEGRMLPRYEGSNSEVFRPLPVINVRRAGTAARFRSPRDGASFGILESGRFVAGPTFKIKMPRKESDDSSLRGLGDVGWTVEAGAFAEYWPTDWLRTRVELRQGIGGHHGLVSDLTADLVYRATQQLTLSGGPRVSLATAAATSPYFSVTPGQSIASGLPVYDARGGVRSYGVGAQARYLWSPVWATYFFAEYERLSGDAANAPLVTTYGNRNQLQLGLGVTYSFDVKGLW
jgi:outer membrane protein